MNVNKINELLAEFWQRSSDACPLECGDAEKQEIEFKNFVNEKFKTWTFEDAASFMMKWLAENEHPHTMAEIDSIKAILWEGCKTHHDDSFVVD